MKRDNQIRENAENRNMVNVEFKAEGTHCESCARMIEKQAMKVAGVEKASFSYADGIGRVTFDKSKTHIDMIFKSIEEKGYSCCIAERKEKADARANKSSESGDGVYLSINKKTAGTIFLVLGLAAIGYFLLRFAEVINIPAISENMGLGLIFLVGLLTGFHCVAMCGGFVVGYTAKAAQEGKKTYKSHIMYGVGKTISYTIIGALFGLLGSIIAFTPKLRGTIAILAGLFLLLFGLRMLGVFGFMRKFGIKQPAFISRLIMKVGDRGPLVIGLLNGLMIACGPLQAIYVLAAGTGSMLEGAKMLFVFGLGTLPVMLGFGYLASVISAKSTHNILRFSGVIVIILGLLMLNNGLVLTGSGADWGSIKAGLLSGGAGTNTNTGASGGNAETGVPNNVAVLKDGYQEIYMEVDAGGWTPDTFILKAGVPVKWFIDVKQLTGCNKAIQVPAYNLKFNLKMGEQEVDFIPGAAGTIRWSCWMGMIPGTFIVQDELPTVSSAVAASQTAGSGDATQDASSGAATAAGGCGCGGGSAGGCTGCGGTGSCGGSGSCHSTV